MILIRRPCRLWRLRWKTSRAAPLSSATTAFSSTVWQPTSWPSRGTATSSGSRAISRITRLTKSAASVMPPSSRTGSNSSASNAASANPRPNLKSGERRLCPERSGPAATPHRLDGPGSPGLGPIERGGQGVEIAAVLIDIVFEQFLEERRHPKTQNHGIAHLVAVAIFGKQPAHVVGRAVLQHHLAIDHHPAEIGRAHV